MGFDEEEVTDSSPMRSYKHLVNTVFIVVLIWVGHSVQESTKEIAVLQANVETLKQEFTEAKATLATNLLNKYTQTDAARDLQSRDNAIAQLITRLTAVEGDLKSTHEDMGHMHNRPSLPEHP